MQMITTNEVIREIEAGRKQTLLVVRGQITGLIHGVSYSLYDGSGMGAG